MADVTGDGIGAPAVRWFGITPNDGQNLAVRPRAIYVGVTGNLAVTDDAGTSVTFIAVPVGYHPLRPIRVLSTGTTATSLVGLY
jgi:hypothetical protein